MLFHLQIDFDFVESPFNNDNGHFEQHLLHVSVHSDFHSRSEEDGTLMIKNTLLLKHSVVFKHTVFFLKNVFLEEKFFCTHCISQTENFFGHPVYSNRQKILGTRYLYGKNF